MSYKLGSLFDGSGGFPLSGALCGVEPVWAAKMLMPGIRIEVWCENKKVETFYKRVGSALQCYIAQEKEYIRNKQARAEKRNKKRRAEKRNKKRRAKHGKRLDRQ